MNTPLERTADAIRREMSDIDYTLDSKDADRFFIDLASAALTAAGRPEQLDTATELRTANMIALMDHLARAVNADLADLLADDQSTFPDGHPCRGCDRLAKDHPIDTCEGWR